MQRPCHCLAATHTRSRGDIESAAGSNKMKIWAQNLKSEVVGVSQWHPLKAVRIQDVAGQPVAALWDHHGGWLCFFCRQASRTEKLSKQ